MSYQPPLPPGPGPHAYYGQPGQGAPNPYAGHPAYAGMSSPVQPSSGFNPWVAGLLGALVGMVLTAFVSGFLWFTMGGPLPWEGIDDWADDWTGRVAVGSDGSVPGLALEDAVHEVGGGGYYVEVTCPTTPRVAEDVTTLCRVDDGYERYRVVVLFLDDNGRFEMAEMFAP